MFCPKCGKSVRDDARFCNHCGAVLKAGKEFQDENYDSVQEIPKHSSALKWIILLIVMILALLGGAVFAMFRFGFFDEILPDVLRQNKQIEDHEESVSQEFYQEESTENLFEESETENLEYSESETVFEVEMSTAESIPIETSIAETMSLEDMTMAIEESMTETEADYILPESSSRHLMEGDLDGLTKEELRLARNEIYARHGRIYTSDDLRGYFASKSWYHGTVSASDFSDDLLSQVEKDNIQLIKKKEEQMQ